MKTRQVVRRIEFCSGCGRLIAVRAFPLNDGVRWTTPVSTHLNGRSGCCNQYLATLFDVVDRRTAFAESTYTGTLARITAWLLRPAEHEDTPETPNIPTPDPTPRGPVQTPPRVCLAVTRHPEGSPPELCLRPIDEETGLCTGGYGGGGHAAPPRDASTERLMFVPKPG